MLLFPETGQVLIDFMPFELYLLRVCPTYRFSFYIKQHSRMALKNQSHFEHKRKSHQFIWINWHKKGNQQLQHRNAIVQNQPWREVEVQRILHYRTQTRWLTAEESSVCRRTVEIDLERREDYWRTELWLLGLESIGVKNTTLITGSSKLSTINDGLYELYMTCYFTPHVCSAILTVKKWPGKHHVPHRVTKRRAQNKTLNTEELLDASTQIKNHITLDCSSETFKN
jgi:hypothetical protein